MPRSRGFGSTPRGRTRTRAGSALAPDHSGAPCPRQAICAKRQPRCSRLATAASPDLALREDADIKYEIFGTNAKRRALRAMLLQAVPITQDGYEWERIEAYVAEYDAVTVPTLIIWGARDETLPVAMGYKLSAQLPSAQLFVIPECMHSPHLLHPKLTSSLIRTFTETAGLSEELAAEGERFDPRSMSAEPTTVLGGGADD